jgi:hypothetical protein
VLGYDRPTIHLDREATWSGTIDDRLPPGSSLRCQWTSRGDGAAGSSGVFCESSGCAIRVIDGWSWSRGSDYTIRVNNMCFTFACEYEGSDDPWSCARLLASLDGSCFGLVDRDTFELVAPCP